MGLFCKECNSQFVLQTELPCSHPPCHHPYSSSGSWRPPGGEAELAISKLPACVCVCRASLGLPVTGASSARHDSSSGGKAASLAFLQPEMSCPAQSPLETCLSLLHCYSVGAHVALRGVCV